MIVQKNNRHNNESNNHPRLKSLYLMEHGTTLGKEQERFVIKYKGKVKQRIPAIHVDQILVYGNSQLTTQVMQYCLKQHIPIYLLSGNGQYYGMVDSFSTRSVLLHKEQFLRANDPDFCLSLAKQFIKGKISNTRLILNRLSRHRKATAFEIAAQQLKWVIKQIDTASTLDQLRGFEGNAARIHFQSIVTSVDAKWGFHGRVKRPATDPINALLSYGYSLLLRNIISLLKVRGLNSHIGYLHPIRRGHPALASDVIEEFRSIVVDTVVLNIILNNKLSLEDFKLPSKPGEACYLTDSARRLFTQHIESKLNSQLTHPESLLKLDYRRCIEHQINHLASVIEQRGDNYKPLILR